MNKKSFASDNYASVHPDILNAVMNSNKGHVPAYGADIYTQEAIEVFKQQFGSEIDVYFVSTGTAANVLGLSSLLKSYQGIICAENAHINMDEAGAPEKYTGSKLLKINSPDGKITTEDIKAKLLDIGNQHRSQPKIISITQATELGGLYTLEEIKEISNFAHARGLYIHMDGARLCNAAVALNVPLASLTKDVGIDLLSFGGTKNGMMLGEAIIFFDKTLSRDFPYIRKQGMQLVSKMRFISSQFTALLSNDLWKKNAQHANTMASLLAEEVQKIPEVKISRHVQTNAVFAYLDRKLATKLQEKYFFYIWNEAASEVRWMTSFDTTKEDVLEFADCIKSIIFEQNNK